MPLKILVDEDSQAKALVSRLRRSGHDVLTVNETGLASLSDEQVLDRARAEGRVLLTRNCADFQELHAQDPDHTGILAVHEDRDPSKHMSYADIVSAVAKVEASSFPLERAFLVLNAWRV